MTQPIILRLALPTPLRRLFDYLPPQAIDNKQLTPGIRVRVPFGHRSLVGILISIEKNSLVPYEKLKHATELLDSSPLLTPDIEQLCLWAADYYHYSLGEVLFSALPTLLRKGDEQKRTTLKQKKTEVVTPDEPPALNAAQQTAVTSITAAKSFCPILLDGVTGSGKTEVYLRVIDDVLQKGKQVLVLVPEISLTPQTIQRFRARFTVPVVAMHSGLSERQRLQAWLDAQTGVARIVIGTRSAIFTPLAQPGLIIVDEEHDTSFKQQDRFRYHARDLAILRASINQIPIVLGSATPSLESLLNVKRQRYQYLSLPERAGNAQMPDFKLIDLRRTAIEEGLSQPLLDAMHAQLAQNNQVMLFLNRRGFAPVLYCSQCTWIAGCQRCDTRMVYHRSPLRLQCHHCDTKMAIPERCLQCNESNLQPVGLGTQRLEQALEQHFPGVAIIRVDRDNTRRKGSMQNLLAQINQEQKAILLGTQMLAKGHHFPQVTLVGVVDADSGLFSVDFRAAEQMGQLLLQVAGRAGRADKHGSVWIQTRHPDHPLWDILLKQGYQAFAQMLLQEREQALLPPYSYFAVIRAEAYQAQQVNHFLTAIKKMVTDKKNQVTALGPVPALIARRKGLHCQHLIVKSGKRSSLQELLKEIAVKIEENSIGLAVKWLIDVDPIEV